jgi:transcriptional regulator with XRE-family HTH domain
MDDFGTRLKTIREARGINRKALGELCGRSKNLIGQYEAGQKHPSAATLIELADCLGVSVDVLLGRLL